MQNPLAQAAAAGSKVVLVDTTLKDRSLAISEVASDNEGGGKAAFEALKALNPNGGKVMVMSVDPGISTNDARTKGFVEVVQADSTFKYLGVQYSHNDPATASQLISAALQKDPDMVGVFANNLLSAEGTSTGVKQAGKNGQVKIAAFDAGPTRSKPSRKAPSTPSSHSRRPPLASTDWTRPLALSTGPPSRRRCRRVSPSSLKTTSTPTASRPPTSRPADPANRPPGRPPGQGAEARIPPAVGGM